MEFTEKDLLLILPSLVSTIMDIAEEKFDGHYDKYYDKVLDIYGDSFFTDVEDATKKINSLIDSDCQCGKTDGLSDADKRLILLFKIVVGNVLNESDEEEMYD